MVNSTLLNQINTEIENTQALGKKYSLSWKYYERLSLLLAQKEAIKDGKYAIEKRRFKDAYQTIVYFADGTSYSYTAPYRVAVS